jgi:transcriptional regulator with XRE-family HTH domain
MTADQAIRRNQGSGSMQEILEMLGKRIRSERKGKRLSEEGFAEVCGLHRTEVGLLERGKTIPRLDTLLLVSQHLDLAVSELLQGIEP